MYTEYKDEGCFSIHQLKVMAMSYTLQFRVIWNNLDLFLQGILVTIELAALSISCGLVLGVLGALGRTSKVKLWQFLAGMYVEFFRNTPFLIQMFFFYFGLSSAGLRMSSFQAAALSLTINFGAYATEIFRAGIEGIGKGQLEAGKALGLRGVGIFRHVIIMPAIGKIYPSLISQMVIAVLFTSVASQISTEELTFVGRFLDSRSFRSFEIYLTISVLYLAIVWAMKLLAYAIQRRFFHFMRFVK